ncbi:GspH/FimT family protein [Methylotuvimicrobium buryatense]|uniref:Type II secretion system protein H n=1 Tax=Methylotuvimicrobium buryatense TaxID=95641 RepID=A0A4P9UVM8_METBY|nr:GspH/FimT family protein [Methylotuvimicrobium buryatense]QCW84830.1 prepilin-type N-terminal cleavage/methylation domain-containing protein [Methylotuvimicrobium buryatense]
MKNQTNQGFTLLEALITIAIAAIILVLAVPSYRDVLERNRLKGAVESVADDLKFTRTQAIKQSTDVTLELKGTTDWCYGISLGNSGCDCETVGSCSIKVVDGTQFSDIALDGDNSATFLFRRGTTDINNNIEITLNSPVYTARIIVNRSGRVFICTPGGTTGLPSYPDC